MSDKIKRNQYFCKQRKKNIQANMQLSIKANIKVLCIYYDEEMDRITIYQSHSDFSLKEAHLVKSRIATMKPQELQIFSN
jgi:hypothetical protein